MTVSLLPVNGFAEGQAEENGQTEQPTSVISSINVTPSNMTVTFNGDMILNPPDSSNDSSSNIYGPVTRVVVSHPITVYASEGGQAKAFIHGDSSEYSGGSVDSAQAGKTIGLRITIDEGYSLSSISVTNTATGASIPVSAIAFTMPDGPVTVDISFAKLVSFKTSGQQIPIDPASGDIPLIEVEIPQNIPMKAVHNISSTVNGEGTVNIRVAGVPANSAYENDLVTIEVVPNYGYELESLFVTNEWGGSIWLVNESQFNMPDCAVYITATFRAISASSSSQYYSLSLFSLPAEGGDAYFTVNGVNTLSARPGDYVQIITVPYEGYELEQAAVYVEATGVKFTYTSPFQMPESRISAEVSFREKEQEKPSEPENLGMPIDAGNFPDANFRYYVGFFLDGDKNGYLSDTEIQSVTEINCSQMEIASLRGIEYFYNLISLNCSQNRLTELDLNKNVKLRTLYCAANSISYLYISGNTELTSLICGPYNPIQYLDLSGNPNLENLDCSNCDVYQLEIFGNPALKAVNCANNHLSSLFTVNNSALSDLRCQGNNIAVLDLANNALLLDIYKNGQETEAQTFISYITNAGQLKIDKTTQITPQVERVQNAEEANAQEKEFKITLEPSEHGTFETEVNGKKAASAPEGATVKVITRPDAGYYAEKIEAAKDGYYIVVDGQFEMPLADVSIRVTFLPVPDSSIGVEINAANFPDQNFRQVVRSFDKAPKDDYLSGAELAMAKEMICTGNGYKAIHSYQGIEYFTSLEKLSGNGCGAELDLRKNKALQEISGFKDCTELKTVYLPDGLRVIAAGCFGRCASLTNINFPSSLTYIGDSAFADCDLKQAIIPSGVTIIQNFSFSGNSNLSDVVLPNTVTKIGKAAFSGTNLTHITLPASLRQLGDIETGRARSSVSYPVFGDCPLVSITLPEGLTFIGSGTFSGCKFLSEVNLPESLIEIGPFAFSGCVSLQALRLPSNLQRIDVGAFDGCTALQSVLLPQSISKIENTTGWVWNHHAFYDCHPEFIAYVYAGSKALGYCQRNKIAHLILGESFTATATLFTDLSQSVFHSFMAYVEADGGAKPFSYQYTIFKNGIELYTTDWLKTDRYEFIPVEVADFSFTVTVKDQLGNTVVATSNNLEAKEPPEIDVEANKRSMFYHTMVGVFNSAKSPEKMNGVTYYQSLPEGSNLYAAFLKAFSSLDAPASAVMGFGRYSNGSDETEYFVKSAIQMSATGNTWTFPHFDALPDAINVVDKSEDFMTDSYLNTVTNWLIQLSGKSRSDINNDTFQYLKSGIRDSMDSPEDSPIQGFDRLGIMGFSDEQCKLIENGFSALKTLKTVISVAKTVTSMYNSIADVYNQMALVQSLDSRLLLQIAKSYRDHGVSSAEKDAGRLLVDLVSASPLERAGMIFSGKVKVLGLDLLVDDLDRLFNKQPENGALILLDGINYTYEELFGTQSVTDAIIDLGYTSEMVQNSWLVFTNARHFFEMNPSEQCLEEAYYAFISYYKACAVSERAFVSLIEKGNETLLKVGFGGAMVEVAEQSSKNADILDTVVDNMQIIYSRWITEGNEALKELYNIIDNIETSYDSEP